MIKVYTSIYNLRAGDWLKVLSLSPEDIRYPNKEAYAGKLYTYHGSGYFERHEDPLKNLIRFKTGMTYTQDNLH